MRKRCYKVFRRSAADCIRLEDMATVALSLSSLQGLQISSPGDYARGSWTLEVEVVHEAHFLFFSCWMEVVSFSRVNQLGWNFLMLFFSSVFILFYYFLCCVRGP